MSVDWSIPQPSYEDLHEDTAFYEMRAAYYSEKLWEARAQIIALEEALKRANAS